MIIPILFSAALLLSCSPARSAESSGAISYQCNGQEYTEESRFGASLDYVFTDLIGSTPRIAGYNLYVVSPPATGGPPVYGHARCLYSLTASECASCLRRSKRQVKSICPSRIGGWVFTGYYCFLRYEAYNFSDEPKGVNADWLVLLGPSHNAGPPAKPVD